MAKSVLHKQVQGSYQQQTYSPVDKAAEYGEEDEYDIELVVIFDGGCSE